MRHTAVIDNEASRLWLSCLEKARDAFGDAGLPRFAGAPDHRLYDIESISSEASRIVSKRGKRSEGGSLHYQIMTRKNFASGKDEVIVEWVDG